MQYVYLAITSPSDNSVIAFETATGAVAHLIDYGMNANGNFRVMMPGKYMTRLCEMKEVTYEHLVEMVKWLESYGYLRFSLCTVRALKIPFHPVDDRTIEELRALIEGD
jgi:hypothetical protein